jgi:outer membrane protein
MKVNVVKIFCCFVVLFSLPSAKVYTVDGIISEAVKNSKSIKIIEQQMYKAESQIQEAFGNALPSINASVNFKHSFNPNGSSSDEPIASESLQEVADLLSTMLKQKSNASSFGVALQQPIYAQGKVNIGLKIANTYRSTLNCKLQDEKIKVKAAVIKLFYASLLAQKNVQIANETVKIAEEAHHLAVVREAIGKSSDLDTLTSRLHLKNAQIEFLKAQSDLRLSNEALMTAAGIVEPSSAFGVEGDFPAAEFNLTVDQALDLLHAGNNTISQFKGQNAIQEQLIKLAKTDLYPLVYGGISIGKIGQFDKIDGSGSIKWCDDQSIFIGASWDIFTGMKRNKKINQAVIDKEIFVLTEKQTIDNLELGTRTAFEKVVTSKEQLNSTLEVISLAEKSFSIAKKSYEIGSKTFLDMQNAELDLNKAKILNNAALYAFHSALIDLNLLLGKLQGY